MRKSCGLVVARACVVSGRILSFLHTTRVQLKRALEKLVFFLGLHNFYAQVFTIVRTFFSSVRLDIYTVCTPLIIMKTIYIK